MKNSFAVKLAVGSALAVAVFGLLFFALAPSDSSVTTDDGAYALEVAALQSGRWNVEYAHAAADPDGVAMPYRASQTDNGYFTLSKTPAWLKASQLGRDMAGIAGQRAIVIAGAAMAVAVSGLIGLRVGGRTVGVLAATFAASSPILFNGLQLWAHSVAAAGIGVVVIGLMMAQFDRRVLLGTLLAVGGAGVAAAVRSDGLAVAAAIVALTGLRALLRRDAPILLTSAIVGVAAVGTHVASGMFMREVTGAGTLSGAARPRATSLTDPLQGAAHTLLSEMQAHRGAYLAIVAALILTGYATYLLRECRHRHATIALGVAGVLWVLRTLIYTGDAATGLIAAWPVVAVAVLLVDRPLSAEVTWLGLLLVASAVAVTAGQSKIGGGFNWGGRYFSTAIPILAVLVAVALEPHIRARGGQRVVAGGFVALSVVTCVSSIAFDLDHRLRHDRMIAAVEAASHGVPIVVERDVLPMLAWRTYGDIDWLVVPDEDDGGIERLRAILSASGVEKVLLVQTSDNTAAGLSGQSVDTSGGPIAVYLAAG